jgi:tetratricopeptide (TPR) repeat protein
MRTHISVSTVALFVAVGLGTACSQPGQTQIARGNVLASKKDFAGAIAAYRAAAEASPAKAHPRELLGHLLFDLGRFKDARAAYEEALRVEPHAAIEARFGLARLDADEFQFDRAVRRLSEVLEQQPKNLYALLSRASLELQRGDTGDAERAIEDTATAMTISPKGIAVLYLRGSSFLAARQFDSADEAFSLLERAHPNLPLAFYGHARVASARGDKAEALRQLRTAREKARQGSDEWDGSAILRDPALQLLKGDPEFAAVVGARGE